MQQALESTQRKIQDINYINTHGTSSPLGDDVEIKAIQLLLKDHSPAVKINAHEKHYRPLSMVSGYGGGHGHIDTNAKWLCTSHFKFNPSYCR